jgi:carbon-monoxide dehydrogenase medium subunit
MGCALLALDSKVEIVGPDSTRDVALSDFYIGSGETVLKNNEIVKEIIIPALKSSTGTVFLRATRSDADLATVNVAVTMTMEGDECIDARVVLGSVSTTLLRVKEAEKVLRDHAIDEALAEKSGRIASDATNPRDEGGVRASIDYKKHMAQVLTKEATMIACKRAKQEQD